MALLLALATTCDFCPWARKIHRLVHQRRWRGLKGKNDMAIKITSPARLWALLARREPVGVIFRRGPSKQVMLIKWNTQQDSFELGQWFKGRVYERRCDLSPNGELIIYFAAKQKPPLY